MISHDQSTHLLSDQATLIRRICFRGVVALLALATASCNTGVDPIGTSLDVPSITRGTTTESSSTAAQPATAEPSFTTTQPPVESTTQPPAVSTTTAPSWEEVVLGIPDPLPGSQGASGSGCAPGSSSLPTGVWFGFLVSRDGYSVEFDLACWYWGDIAREKAAEVGEIAYGDYWITNENPRLRSLSIADDAVVWAITGDATEGYEAIPISQWTGAELTYNNCPGDSCAFWLYVIDGVVEEMVDQYRP